MTAGDLNVLNREEFVAALGWLFEDSPWVAERTWSARPFPTMADLSTAKLPLLPTAIATGAAPPCHSGTTAGR